MNNYSTTINTGNDLNMNHFWPERKSPEEILREKASLHVRELEEEENIIVGFFKKKFKAANSFDFRLKKLPMIYKYTLIPILTIAVFLASFLVLKPTDRNPSNAGNTAKGQLTVNSEITAIDNVQVPIILKIPKIEVDSLIEEVGITEEGTLDVPSDAANAGWYKDGVKPGEVGSAVIDGHLDTPDASAGVFSELHLLEIGDTVTIVDGGGKTINFTVKNIKTYNADDFAADVFGQNDKKIRLNLITCKGIWDYNKATYNERLVVFTEADPSQ